MTCTARHCIVAVLLFLLPVVLRSQPPAGQQVKVKAHCYLVHNDTIIYCSCDTVFELPDSSDYKIKKDISAFLVKPFHGKFLGLVYKAPEPVAPANDTVVSTKSEVPFMAYQDKIIRSITIIPLDVTGSRVPSFMASHKSQIDSVADAIHVTTKKRVIANNLLFKVGDSLNPYLLADNERNLRNLPFIHDARIMVDTVPSSGDSVDVIVITKDVWTIGFASAQNWGSWYRFRIFDANFLGYGQRLEFSVTKFSNRDPQWGGGISYSKNNLFGKFVNLNLGLSNINGGPRLGGENEQSVFLNLSRPLYLPTTHYTGGISLSLNQSLNVFGETPAAFRSYKYGLIDAWSAFSLSPARSEKRRLRKGEGAYLSGRFFQQYFFDKPDQYMEKFNAGYNNRWFVVGGLNFFRDSYYKTRYVTGFGKTEDIPYGYRLSVLGGYQYLLYRYRYYAGIEFERQFANPVGRFGTFQVAVGSFFHRGHAQDVIFHVKTWWYSRLFYAWRMKLRQKFYASYAIVLNPAFTGLQVIPNGESGIRGFSAGYPIGRQRIVAHTETTVWMPWIIWGFRFAGFVSVEVAEIGPNDSFLLNEQLYSGIGGGFRMKNENTVFKTLEVRAFYYPHVPPGGVPWLIDMSTVVELNFSEPQIHVPGFVGFD